MIEPKPSSAPFDSAHHTKTSLGDTFGGLGVCDEVQEELVRERMMRGKRTFLDHGTHSASAIPRIRDPYDGDISNSVFGV